MSGYIDVHTHAFPDELAARAISYLEKEGDIKACLDGTLADLLQSMDRAGIEKSLICSIATKPAQFKSIFAWSKAIRSERLIPLPSVHPMAVDLKDQLRMISDEGFAGIKLHPYYQDFFIDDARLDQLYRLLVEYNLLLVMHTGYDIAFPRMPLCDPQRIVGITQRFPELKLITTHLGAWDDWERVRELLIGRPVYMELSFSLDFLDPETAREMITSHPPEYLLFGSDSPWADQQQSLDQLGRLGLDSELLQRITRDNAEYLLSQVNHN